MTEASTTTEPPVTQPAASLAPDVTQAAPPSPEQYTPHQRFLEQLPEAFRADPVFKNFGGLEDLARSYKSAASLVGLDKGMVLRLPSEDTPEAMGEVWDKLGRPATFDAYDVGDVGIDKAELEEYTKLAHENGVSNKAFKALLGKVMEKGTAGQEQSEAAKAAQVAEWQSSIKAEYGEAYNDKLALAKAAVKNIGGDELIAEIQADPHLFEKPAIIKAFVKMGEQMQKIAQQTKEDNGFLPGAAGASSAMSPPEAKAAIAELEASAEYKKVMFDPIHPQRQAMLDKMQKMYAYAYPSSQAAK